MILKQYIDEYIITLKEEVYIEEIYKLVAHYYNISMNQLKIDYLRKEIASSDIANITVILDKYYIQKIPLQYIIGYTYFYNEKYIVNENTLIPRPDTEVLVSEAIKYIEKYNLNTCIDMCTGTGAVGISIANNSSIKQVTLIDISDKALEVAKENITLNKVNNKCNILSSNLFANVPKESKIDILVSNPPYIKTEVINMLDEHVKKEPILALDGGINGLDVYDRILKEAKIFLNNNAYVLFEIGYDQKQDLVDLINKYNYEYIDCKKDIEGRDRVVVCRFHQI